MTSWEERMSQRTKARMSAETEKQREAQRVAYEAEWGVEPFPEIPQVLAAELPDGVEDVARFWCTVCGLPDAPERPDQWSRTPPCPACGSMWRWYGRIADRDGTATNPPLGECWDCFDWRRNPGGQAHFGWTWWMVCRSIGAPTPEGRLCRFGHDHHDGEIWLA